ncbi:hypothetical protein Bca52824_079966 [Brassica carinata]|uniref:Uncharacterized protein n=1 Tax=Brassica carinata TaxID=52824 RepID=A0A8X7TZT1_BRACI|nr:hypothetical protein Bca52824_079966 [Brassica carinata]
MASNFLLIVLLALVSISVTSGYSFYTRDAVLKKYDDESYFRASSEKVPSMIAVKDLAKARNLQAIVVVNKASKSWSLLKRKRKSNKVGSLDVLTLVVIIIVAVIVTIVIMALLFNLYYKLKTKMTQSIGQVEVGVKEISHGKDEKTETVTMSPQAGKRSNGDANV